MRFPIAKAPQVWCFFKVTSWQFKPRFLIRHCVRHLPPTSPTNTRLPHPPELVEKEKSVHQKIIWTLELIKQNESTDVIKQNKSTYVIEQNEGSNANAENDSLLEMMKEALMIHFDFM